jgi:hypothetical protein
LAATLNEAVAVLGLLPSEWEVDPVSSVDTVYEWMQTHEEIMKFTRHVRLTNALVDVDEDRRLMRELGAREDTQTYKAGRNDTLRLRDNPIFNALIEPLETGDIDVVLVARAGDTGYNTYSSRAHADRTFIPTFGPDLERGIQEVLAVLRQFSEQRGDVIHGQAN